METKKPLQRYTLHDLFEDLRNRVIKTVSRKIPGKIRVEINIAPGGGIGTVKFSFDERIK